MKSLILAVLAMTAVCTAHADVYCRFDPIGQPSSFIRVYLKKGTAMSITGWPEKTTNYRDVVVQNTKAGLTIVVFGDVPLIQATRTNNGTLWFDQNEVRYPFEAYWNPKVAGGPTREAKRGVCWTDKLGKIPTNPESSY